MKEQISRGHNQKDPYHYIHVVCKFAHKIAIVWHYEILYFEVICMILMDLMTVIGPLPLCKYQYDKTKIEGVPQNICHVTQQSSCPIVYKRTFDCISAIHAIFAVTEPRYHQVIWLPRASPMCRNSSLKIWRWKTQGRNISLLYTGIVLLVVFALITFLRLLLYQNDRK